MTGGTVLAPLAPHAASSRRAPDATVTSMLSPAVGSLVTEMASGLYPLATLMQRYGLSKSQMRNLLTNEVFRRALIEAQNIYTSTAHMPERIKLKAQVATEELLESMCIIAAHPSYHPSARVAAFSAVKSLTGLEKPEPQQARQKFSLTINLPAGSSIERHITIEAEANASDPVPDTDPNSDQELDLSVERPLTHDQFKKHSVGYVPRHEPGKSVSIIPAGQLSTTPPTNNFARGPVTNDYVT